MVTRSTRSRHGPPLPRPPSAVNVLAMHYAARLLQIVGLIIPPLAIVAQLTNSIDLKQMLGFLVASVAVFTIGYLMQRYSGGGSA